jgi:hypothetical protein
MTWEKLHGGWVHCSDMWLIIFGINWSYSALVDARLSARGGKQLGVIHRASLLKVSLSCPDRLGYIFSTLISP